MTQIEDARTIVNRLNPAHREQGKLLLYLLDQILDLMAWAEEMDDQYTTIVLGKQLSALYRSVDQFQLHLKESMQIVNMCRRELERKAD